MGIWTGRLGKSLGAIKKEGLKSGTTKIVEALKVLARPVLPGDVLIVTGGTGRSAAYRCYNQAEELNLHGIKTSVAIQDNKRLQDFAKSFQVFIFHRVIVNEKVKDFIKQIKKQNKTIMFETDDLNYDPNYLRQTDYFAQINELERKQIEGGIGAEIFEDEYVSHCVTSTSFLADKLSEKGKQVFVSSNKLSVREQEGARAALEKIRRKENGEVRVGYFSGTPSHDRDFAVVEDVLVDLLQKNGKTRLCLAGPLEIGEKFSGLDRQIERIPFSLMEKHLQNIASVDINIVPLEDNDFCRAKSEIKFIEAGILKVPTVARDNQTFREAISDGTDGMLAGNFEQWREKLQRLIAEQDLRARMGQIAQEKVLERYITKSQGNDEYYNFLKEKIGQR